MLDGLLKQLATGGCTLQDIEVGWWIVLGKLKLGHRLDHRHVPIKLAVVVLYILPVNSVISSITFADPIVSYKSRFSNVSLQILGLLQKTS